MVYLQLKKQIFKKINMSINMANQQDLKVESKFNFSVNYNKDGNACLAKISQEVRGKDEPDKFFINLECYGEFLCEGINEDEDKKMAHVLAYYELFPYVQRMIMQLTTNAGIAPLTIDPAKMKPENVAIAKPNAASENKLS